MTQRNEKEFYLVRLYVDWLSRRQRVPYRWGVGLITGLVAGLASGMAFGLAGRHGGSVFGLVSGLVFGLFGGMSVIIEGEDFAIPLFCLYLSFCTLSFALFFALLFGLVVGPRFGLGAGLVSGLIGALGGGLGGMLLGSMPIVNFANVDLPETEEEAASMRIREFVLLSFRYMLLGWLYFGLITGLVAGLASGLAAGLFSGLISGLFYGLMSGLAGGGLFVLWHYALRFFLWRARCVPWRYVRFLDFAAECILLRRVGFSYIFVHRLLQDYFAALNAKTDSP